MKFPDRQRQKLDERVKNHSFRSVSTNNNLIDFASNDYLGFSRNHAISSGVWEEMKAYTMRNGSTGSRLISGNNELFDTLEVELATFFDHPFALLFNSGYDANLGLLSSVPQRNDMIFYDELCHASIRDGIKLSLASSYKFKHNDLNDLQKKFSNSKSVKGNKFLVIESLYSMDGDFAPLVELADFCQHNNIYLIVDEAHASGIYGNNGEGRVVGYELQEKVFATVHTFGKAFGCHGAVVVGSELLRAYLINFARSFIYTTAMPIHNLLSIKFALDEVKNTAERSKLMENITFFKKQVEANSLDRIFLKSDSAIQSCIISGNRNVEDAANKVNLHNFNVKSIKYPTVPKGMERLRFCIHSFNSEEDIKEVLYLLSTFV